MFTLAGKALAGVSGNSPLTYGSTTFSTPYAFNAGTNWGGTIAWSGGTAPFTVILRRGTTVIASTSVGAGTSRTLTAVADSSWDGATMSLSVTDATGAVVVSHGQPVTVYYAPYGMCQVSSGSPAVGSYISIYLSPVSANPGPTSYQWYYRKRLAAGYSWGGWSSFGSSSSSVTSGIFDQVGSQWEFYCVVCNTVSCTYLYSPTVTVV